MRWFPFINLTLASLIVVILFFVFLLVIPKKEAWSLPQVASGPKSLPSNTFERELIDTAPLALKWREPKIQLPDLSREILYYGLLKRPDVSPERRLIHLALAGEEKVTAFDIAYPIYLTYNGSAKSHSFPEQNRIFSQTGEALCETNYAFTPNNQPSSLWLETAIDRSGSLMVTVNMRDEKGEQIHEPSCFHQFSLAPREIPRMRPMTWEIDNQRVDSTLLIRQKARWIGKDCFLEKHGGDTFLFAKGKERIDFLGDHPYSCFVEEGDFLTWEEGKWVVNPDAETINQSLLVVKKVEDRLISFELWDPEGIGKTLLTLVRSKDLSGFPNLEDEFKFIGAKTLAKFIVESRSERLVLKPHDWLVLTDGGWVALNTPQLIDDYVENTIQGPLLILDKVTKQNGKQCLMGHVFNTSRTEVKQVELPTTTSGCLANIYNFPPSAQYNFDFEEHLE